MTPPLQFLVFSASDDGAGRGSWEAMASVQAHQREAALAEARALLAEAEAQAPGSRGPEEEGGLWDAWLQVVDEADGWTTITFTLVGPLEWGDNQTRPFV